MTDLDMVCRRAATGWSKVARALEAPTDTHRCGPMIERALVAHLRTHGGLEDPLAADLMRLRCDGDEPTHQDFVQVLRMLVRHQVADRVLPGLVAAGAYESYAAAETHLSRCLRDAHLIELANRWMARPDGRGVRASRRRRSRLTDLLGEAAPL